MSLKTRIANWIRNKLWDFLEKERPYRATVVNIDSTHDDILKELKILHDRNSALCNYLDIEMIQTDVDYNGKVTHRKISHDVPTDYDCVSSLGMDYTLIEMLGRGSGAERYIKCLNREDIKKYKKQMDKQGKKQKKNALGPVLLLTKNQKKIFNKFMRKGKP